MADLHYPIEDGGRITWIFGRRDCSVYANPTCEHMGTDFYKGEHSNIYAVLDGEVIESRDLCQGTEACGYGRRVTIQHDGCMTLYAHLIERKVEVGDKVKAGDVVGLMGGAMHDNCRGASSGVHLHFEVILKEKPVGLHSVPKVHCGISNGHCVDPLPYLIENYGESPQYKGNIIESRGVNIRSCPSTSCTKVGVLPYSSAVGVMELFVDDIGNLWGKLLHIGTGNQWFAVMYNGITYAELTLVEPPVEPEPEPPLPVDCEDAVKAANKIARIDEIDKMITYLEARRDEILWDGE